jgi:serine/threonine protein kinase
VVVEGTPFGRYRLIELLGRGGMGEVWRAFDTETQRTVAVKVLSASLVSDPTFEQRFRREALAAAGLNDPHVVPIHHFGEIGGRLYVDMRLIKGRDLQSIIGDGPLPPERAVKIIEQVASALQDAHRIGLVHRDVKPSNILVTENDFAYLIDFGLARTAGETRMTGTGNVIGTWAYMAPERLSTADADPRTDTYALACVLHECLTGRQPFPGDSLEQQIGGHLSEPPPRPSTLRSGLPTQLDAVIATGMAKKPEQRYSTATELAAAARAAISQPTALPGRAAEPVQTQQMAIPPTYYPTSSGEFSSPSGEYAAPGGEYSAAGGNPAHSDPTHYQPYSPPGGAYAGDGPPSGPNGHSAGSTGAKPTGSGPDRKRRLILASSIAAVIAIIGIVAAIALTGGSSKSSQPSGGPGSDAPQPNSGPFTGTYTVALGPGLDMAGREEQGTDPPGNETWKLRSVCGGKGCVATGVRSTGTFVHPTSMVFDDINGRWVAVVLDTERCHGHDIEEWHWIYLRPRPDGSMAGEWIEDSLDCYAKRSVTFTRTGDTNFAGLTDPSTLPARVTSPALSLRGFYRSKVAVPAGEAKPPDQDFSVDTFCLRTGDRCLSRFVLTDFSNHQLFMFANNAWTRNSDYDAQCAAGGVSHVTMTGVFPLPKPAQDPITTLTGHGMEISNGSACKGGPYDQVFSRIRD